MIKATEYKNGLVSTFTADEEDDLNHMPKNDIYGTKKQQTNGKKYNKGSD